MYDPRRVLPHLQATGPPEIPALVVGDVVSEALLPQLPGTQVGWLPHLVRRWFRDSGVLPEARS